MAWRNQLIRPNLGVLLIGGSGTRKSTVANLAVELAPPRGEVGLVRNRVNVSTLFSRFCSPNPGDLSSLTLLDRATRIWLVADELSDTLKGGNWADDLFKFIVGTYDDQISYADDTITHGDRVIIRPLLNLLAGSTMDWLRRAVAAEHVEAGPFARLVPIAGPLEIVPELDPGYPTFDDLAALKAQVRTRMLAVSRRAPFWYQVTPAAQTVHDALYALGRPPDRSLGHIWQRRGPTLWKLAMALHTLDAEAGFAQPVLTSRHLVAARALFDRAMTTAPLVLRAALSDRQGLLVESLRLHLSTVKAVKQSALARIASDLGFSEPAKVYAAIGALKLQGCAANITNGPDPTLVWLPPAGPPAGPSPDPSGKQRPSP